MPKLFVTGATGAVGRRAIPRLLAAGYDVTGVARGEEKAALLQSFGATPVAVDLFDASALTAALSGHDAIVNLATHIPPPRQAAKPGAWAENNRIRSEVSANIAAVAPAAGVRRWIQESITLPYPDRGDEWISEEVALDPAPLTVPVQIAETNAMSVKDSIEVVVLRYGLFYAPDSDQTRDQIRVAGRSISPLLGPHERYMSNIHTDDAAAAVVAAFAAAPGIYNVVDDDPVRRSDYAALLATAVGRKKLSTSVGQAARIAGDKRTGGLMRSHRVSNAKFRESTGWAPRYPSVREGLPEAAREILAAGQAN